MVRLTTHDRKLTVDGELYAPVGSFSAAAFRKNAALEESDTEFRGSISSAALTAADFNSGKYRDCEVTERRVDSRWAWMGSFQTNKYWIGNTKWDGESFECVCTGIPRWLRPKIGDVLGRNCRHDLGVKPVGQAGCGVVIASFTVTGVVVLGMIDGEKRRVIRAASGPLDAFADNYFNSGDVLFTAGANVGVPKKEIKTWTQSTREIQLQLGFPNDIAPADVFTIVAGCNKLGSTCITKFNQFPDFGGYPDAPGTDKVLRVTPQG